MKHVKLVDKYKRAQKHYEKGNYRIAKWLFEQIDIELTGSDSDSMGDIYLHNNVDEYLDLISRKKLSNLRIPTVVIIIVISLKY